MDLAATRPADRRRWWRFLKSVAQLSETRNSPFLIVENSWRSLSILLMRVVDARGDGGRPRRTYGALVFLTQRLVAASCQAWWLGPRSGDPAPLYTRVPRTFNLFGCWMSIPVEKCIERMQSNSKRPQNSFVRFSYRRICLWSIADKRNILDAFTNT